MADWVYSCLTTRVTILTLHVLQDWQLTVFWITNYVSTEWLGLAENARLIIIIICCVHILCLVCSVGSTHTGPQRCVTLMIPYWSSLLKWHHHHYHSISRPLIGQAGDNPALSLADSKLWSYWHSVSLAGASLTHVFAPSQSTYYWANISASHLTRGKELYIYTSHNLKLSLKNCKEKVNNDNNDDKLI